MTKWKCVEGEVVTYFVGIFMNQRRKEMLNLRIASSRSIFEPRTFRIRKRCVRLDRDVLSLMWFIPLVFLTLNWYTVLLLLIA
jgi:hypothetical protein